MDVSHSNSSQPALIRELRSVCSVIVVYKWKGNSGVEAFLSFGLLAVEFNPVGIYKMKVTLHVIAKVSPSHMLAMGLILESIVSKADDLEKWELSSPEKLSLRQTFVYA